VAGPDTSPKQGWRTPNQMIEVLRQSTRKQLIGLSRHLARWERFHEVELGLGRVAMQALMATMDSIQLHRISLTSRVLLESPKAFMSSQYLCGTSRQDTSHIVYSVFIRDGRVEMQSMRALIDCGATSIFMAPRLRKRLGLADKPVYVTTLGLKGHLMAHASESRKTTFTVQYMEHLSPVQESEVLVVPMQAYDLVSGLPWFQSWNPDVDLQSGRLLALRPPGGAEVVAVDWVDHQECTWNVPGSMAREEVCSEGGGGIPDIQILGATAFDDLLASEQVVVTFFLRVGDCTRLLGATVEGITDGEGDRPQALHGRAGSSGGSCGRRASTCEP